jgi:hypothetical protein
MDVYTALRDQARKKRDEAIADARATYNLTMRRISELAKGMGDPPPKDVEPEWLPIKEAIIKLAPPDRSFTGHDAFVWLREDAPNRPLRLITVRVIIQRLCEAGRLKRVRWGGNGLMRFALPECPEDAGRWGAMNYPQAMELLLRERGPMRCVEIAIALHEEGFRPGKPQRDIYGAAYTALRSCPRFCRVELGRWDLSGETVTQGRPAESDAPNGNRSKSC